MKNIGIFLIGLVLFGSTFQFTEGVKCYQCVFIEGVDNRDMNPNCVTNVQAKNVHSEEGVACLTAKGEIGGKSFVLRRAFFPGQPKDFPASFPSGQKLLPCHDERVTKFGIAPVTTVSDRKVDTLKYCILCNNRDACNEAPTTFQPPVMGLNVLLTVIVATFILL